MGIFESVKYPFYGVYYFSVHSHCWWIFKRNLAAYCILILLLYSVAVVSYILTMMATGGVVALLATSIFQVSSFFVNFITKKFLIPGPIKETFDYVVNKELSLGVNRLSKGVLDDELAGYPGENTVSKFFRRVAFGMRPAFWLFRQVAGLLLNLIPLVGPILVIIVKAPNSGFKQHSRYFHLKGYNRAQINYFWSQNRFQYLLFGIITSSFEQIPVICFYFYFTNITGAALWAIHVEKQYKNNVIEEKEE